MSYVVGLKIEAEQVVDHLKQRGVPVEYVLFPDEGHGWQKSENRIRSTSRSRGGSIVT